ncbi:MAG: VWA domain-containing protein [Planctomycetota bacterium]|nr:VWA domain-containing protein [Planctomycetota bacterium]
MNFAAPLVLWALPLVLVPIIIHLLQKRRFRRVEFSAMDFLMRAVRRTRRRVLLEDVLLLILRTLAVLFLILALARPNSEDLPLVLGRDARAEVLILDASLSMNHLGEGQSAYGKALSIAAKRLRELDPKMEDRAAVIRAGMRAERVASGDPDEVRSVLEELEMADPSQGDLLGALHAAARTVEDLGPDPSRISVTVLTDLQANTWNIESGFSAPFAELVALGCDVQVLDCGASLRPNVGVTGIELSTPRLVRGDSCSVLISLRNFGETEATVQATLLMDETPIASESFVLGGRQPMDWNVAVAPIKSGARALEVRLEHDALVGDDTRASILDVGDGFRVMIAGEASAPQDTPNVFDGMWRYLSLGEWAPLRPTALPLPLVDQEALAEFDLLILADAGRVPLRTAEGIASFVKAGGGLMIALGPQTGQGELQNLLQQLGAVGLSVGTPIQAVESPARLDIVDANTPALRFFNDVRWKPLLTEVPHATYRPLNVDPNLAENLHIGLRFLQQDANLDSGAALVDWKLGQGQVAVLASSPLPGWNRMEELPGGTLPLIYDLLFSLAPKPGFPVSYPVGSALSLRLNHPPTDTQLRDPAGLLLNGLADLESLENGRTRLELLESVPRPGVWHLNTRLLLPDGEEVLLEQPLAVVIPTEESDLRAAEAASLLEFLPESVRIGNPDEDLVQTENADSPPRDLTRILLLLVLGFLVSETLCAWFLDRRRNL